MIVKQPNKFILETLVDFPDDALFAKQAITHQHIDAMMSLLKGLGIRRVSWCVYGDGHGGFFMPNSSLSEGAEERGWSCYAQTLDLLRNPLEVAVRAAHRHGLELYAYYKPYETGIPFVAPEGSPAARAFGRLMHIGGRLVWLDRFVLDNPHLRIQRCSDTDVKPGNIRCVKLIKKDDTFTRLNAEHLQIWKSDLNYGYQRLDVPFEVSEHVEVAAQDVYDKMGVCLTRKGDPVRTLTLSGLNLSDSYYLITTSFRDGPADFSNVATAMITAFNASGEEIPLSVATAKSLWQQGRDFRIGGLDFDDGFGGSCMNLDVNNQEGNDGLIAFKSGLNQYLPGALCETEPAVQTYWLTCVREMLDVGVDGIDFREESHSTHTNFPKEYGFNTTVVTRCDGDLSGNNVSRVRGDAYTEFLRKAKALCAERGKRMRINFQVDWYRDNPPQGRALAYPANMEFQWRRWIEEELCDEAILRSFALPPDSLFEDEIATEIIERCHRKAIPIVLNRYLGNYQNSFEETYKRTRSDARFSGFIFYETADFINYDDVGGCSVSDSRVLDLCR